MEGSLPQLALCPSWAVGGVGRSVCFHAQGKKIVSGPPHSNPFFPENEPTQAQWAGRGLAGSAQVWLPAAG